MGRGVSSPSNVVNSFLITLETEDEDGVEVDIAFEYECIMDQIVNVVGERWPSFCEPRREKWLGTENRVLLYNDFAYIGISEYCGDVNVWLASREEEYRCHFSADDQKVANLCRGFCNGIAPKFEDEKTFFA